MHGTEIVSALRASLAQRVGKERFDLWFGPTTRMTLAHGTLTICVPDPFFREWLKDHFRGPIETACRQTLGNCPTVLFEVDATLPAPGNDEPCNDIARARDLGRRTSKSATGKSNSSGGGANGSARHPCGEGGKRRFLDLASFVTGEGNQFAYATAQRVVGQPGRWSPVVFHGPTGVGKTHLLEGIWRAARAARPGSRVVYLTAEQFTTYFLAALRGSGLPNFRQKYRGVDLLLVDDLQFFVGKSSTQVELVYTIDTLLREGRQLVLAADRDPKQIGQLNRDLVTRLQGGMTCPIVLPDYATRLGIVGQMSRRFGMRVPPDVQQYVATHLTAHARELSGALCHLQAAGEAWGRPIDMPLAEQALAELIRTSGRVVRLADVENAVCQVFGVEPAALHSGRRDQQVSHPRMLAMYLARKHTGAAFSEIGRYFGSRSHSTVVSAGKRIVRWMAEQKRVRVADHPWQVEDAIRQVERTLSAG